MGAEESPLRPNKPIVDQNYAWYSGLSSRFACATPGTERNSRISEDDAPSTPGLGTGFRRPAGCEKQLQMPPHTPHHMRSACQSHVCIVFGVVTSSEASCGATWRSRHPSCTKRCVYPQLDIKGANICCRERGNISTVYSKRPHATCLPFIKLGIEF